MKTFLAAIFLLCSVPLLSQSKGIPPIVLEALQPDDLKMFDTRGPHGSDCEFYFDNPNKQANSSNMVLFLPDTLERSIPIRLNGKAIQLELDPSHKWGPKKMRLNYAWKNGDIKVILICRHSEAGEFSEYFAGTIEVKVGNQSKTYNITGTCGC